MYRGAWVLFFPQIFDALQPGTDPDRMKGALYVLRYNAIGIPRISRDWEYLVRLTECLLNAHHENKASVQALVSKATDELIAYLKEPTSFVALDVCTAGLDAAIADIEKFTIPDNAVVAKIRSGLQAQQDLQDREWNVFVDKVLAIANDPTLNWRYVLAASRFVYCMTRRDQATDLRLAKFFANNVQNPHPRIRDFGTV
jgi:proteasome activator subunit 4